MEFYHGSKDPNIKILQYGINTKDKNVYVTNDKLVALIYGAREYPNLFCQFSNGVILFNEIIPNLFDLMFSKKSCFIYTTENADFIPVEQGKNCAMQNCFATNHNVKLIKKELILDCAEELQKFVKTGKLIIKRQNEMSKEQIFSMVKSIEPLLSFDDVINGKKNFAKQIFADITIKELFSTQK